VTDWRTVAGSRDVSAIFVGRDSASIIWTKRRSASDLVRVLLARIGRAFHKKKGAIVS
jgi:hypothetical protein